jgi:hypothetical protein
MEQQNSKKQTDFTISDLICKLVSVAVAIWIVYYIIFPLWFIWNIWWTGPLLLLWYSN